MERKTHVFQNRKHDNYKRRVLKIYNFLVGEDREATAQ